MSNKQKRKGRTNVRSVRKDGGQKKPEKETFSVSPQSKKRICCQCASVSGPFAQCGFVSDQQALLTLWAIIRCCLPLLFANKHVLVLGNYLLLLSRRACTLEKHKSLKNYSCPGGDGVGGAVKLCGRCTTILSDPRCSSICRRTTDRIYITRWSCSCDSSASCNAMTVVCGRSSPPAPVMATPVFAAAVATGDESK
jgi:hypothetical protein